MDEEGVVQVKQGLMIPLVEVVSVSLQKLIKTRLLKAGFFWRSGIVAMFSQLAF